VARLVVYWQLHSPGIEVLFAEKDSSEAFNWSSLLIEDIGLFAADIPIAPFGLTTTITAVYLVPTFGWTGAPEESKISG